MSLKSVESQIDPFFLALSRCRRRRFADTVDLCTIILEKNPYDQAAWVTKCRALKEINYIDDSELEEDGIADLLMDDNAVAAMPRPGTSLSRPMSRSGTQGDQSFRPMTTSGRPLSGFARPGTGSRPGSSSMSVDQAFHGSRPGTSRPATTLGRQLRLGTASMRADPGGFINVDRLDLRRYATRPAIAKTLCDFLIYHDHNPKKALELAAAATVAAEYKDWWWKARLGKCYYQLGLLRDAEKQFQSSLRDQETIITYLELCKVYLRLDQPNTALEYYQRASESFPGDASLLLGIARVYEMLNDMEHSIQTYKKVLSLEASNIEGIASLASNHFYNDQPEIALRYYRRIIQMGTSNTEIWNNVGLCCFYSSQYDLSLSCFDRALSMASDENMADVWYNIGQVAIGVGDLGLAYQAFKVAISVDANHAESYNNLGVLELRKGNVDQALSNFQTAEVLSNFMFESAYNHALLSFKTGDFQGSYTKVEKALTIYPEHGDSMDLKKQLLDLFTMV